MSVTIRPYRPGDRDAVYDICVRTGDAGRDSRSVYPDHELLPSIFAGPYVELEPELAFVADDGDRPVGYILGTADTAAFAAAYRQRWLPRLLDRYPPAAAGTTTPTGRMVALLHRPERLVLPELVDYPAHLHIDLLPEHQRAGHGRALMRTFLAALRAAGVPAVHLGMVATNTAARAFYDRSGFEPLAVADPGPVIYLGRSTDVKPGDI